MSLSKDEVQHIAKLARIGLTEIEEERFQKDLASVFGLIEELKAAKISEIDLVLPEREINRSREDGVVQSDDPQTIGKNFPQTKDGFNKVRSVF